VSFTRFTNNKCAAPGGAQAGAIFAQSAGTVVTLDTNSFAGNIGGIANGYKPVIRSSNAVVNGASTCFFLAVLR
jgi:hypothetical protein